MTGRVIVIGSVNVDLVVSAPRLPRPGETVVGGTFARHDGGKGGNQAVAASRLGARTVLVGAIGDDPFGRDARAALEREGVDTTELAVLAGQATGVALIVVAPDGENQIAVAQGANGSVDAPSVRAALERLRPEPPDVVLVGHEIPTAAAREALRAARAAGVTTILNPAPAGGLDRSTFGLAEVLTPNRSELAAIVAAESARLGRSSPPGEPTRAARTLVEPNAEGSGARAVLVSLGALGATLVARGHSPVDLPAHEVQVVDATGAGDALNGALAAGLAAGLALERAARRAVLAASLSTRRAGARDGLPSLADLSSFEG